jgi:hypothetical protein
MAGLDPAIHPLKKGHHLLMDARVIWVKTRFALLPGHDEKREFDT